ncbi:MAG: DUF4422 domain-containing protein, partial [Proteobacteria bacterium]
KILKPIQVGKKLAKLDLGIIGDDQGDNISSKNPEFCELTGQYYVWKNDLSSDYYGFMHYRRLLDFSAVEKRSLEATGMVHEEDPSQKVLSKYGLDEKTIESFVTQFDAVIPDPFDVSPASQSVREQYLTAPYHHIEHLETAGNILKRMHPKDYVFFEKMMNGTLLYPNNMFVMTRLIFQTYSEWLFKILFELEKSIDVSGMTWQEKRAVGYIAERLFTVYALKLLSDKSLKIAQVRRVFISNPTLPPTAEAPPTTNLQIVTIAASTDKAYVQHMAALISSTLSHGAKDRFFDFNILDGGIGTRNQNALKEMEQLHPHCRISFIDMSSQHLTLTTNSYFTRSTFYRLSLPSLLKDRTKVLFLDTDMVVLRDVAELYDMDLQDNIVAASRDIVMQSFISMGVRSIAETGGVQTSKYLADYVQLKKGVDYFQAGVMLINLEKMRQLHLSDKMIHALRNHRYWFLDQDVLNQFVAGRVRYIDERWNTIFLEESHLAALSAKDQLIYEKTMEDPWIVHYAGYIKPWERGGHPFANEYWNALRKTKWYEIGLFTYISRNPSSNVPQLAPMPARLDLVVRKSL